MGKNKPKMVTIQVIKSFNEGRVLMPGDRIEVQLSRAKKMQQLLYAIIIDPEAPYTHPANKKEHQFQEVDLDEPETKEPEPVEPEPETIQKGAEITIPSLNDLTFTNRSHVDKLKKSGINVLNDVEGWDVDGLAAINGVSSKTAMKLIDAYNQYCNLDHNKDSDMKIRTKYSDKKEKPGIDHQDNYDSRDMG